MRSSRTSERWTVMAALFVLISQTLGISGTASAAVEQDTLLPPTPLVLKDGRIANVSIHLLPFDRGDGELGGDAAAGLSSLTAEVATDCFLTAQVIGHVSSREVADSETLEAHRLARSRADAVQRSLIGGGLPAKSIASVWDWQFLVREPRATLWVFRLIEGEDCEGLPLDSAAPELVAENAVPAQAQPAQAEAPTEVPTPVAKVEADEPEIETAQIPPATDVAPKVAEAEAPAPAPVEQAAATPVLPPMVSSAVAAEATPEQSEPPGSSDALDAIVSSVVDAEAQLGDDASAPTEAAQTLLPDDTQVSQPAARSEEIDSPTTIVATDEDEPAQVAVPAGAAVGAVPTVTRPIPALSPSQAAAVESSDEAVETTVAAIEPAPAPAATGSGPADTTPASPQQSAKQLDPDRQGKVEWGQDGNVLITFATNSSYFPPGTTRRLRTMLDGMTSAEGYRVQVQVGVSGTDKVVGATTPEEARRYNQWLAERRMARVQEWLSENAQDRQLEIEPVFQADDSSRRALVRVVPIS